MAILNISDLRARAAELSRHHRDTTARLVLLYCGVLALLSLGSSGLNLLLDSGIGQTGGLDGMGLRSVLQTVEEVLYYVNLLFGPFWTAGFLFAMLGMVRGREPELMDLTAGFRRFGRVLGHLAFDFLVLFTLVMAATNLAAVIFSFTDWGEEFAAMLQAVLEDPNLIAADGTLNADLIPMAELTRAMTPMLVITVLVFLPMYLYVSMCFRMSMYLVVERPISGVQAHFLSMRLMRGHKWQLLKLDLRYWWYYLLGFAATGVGYLDQLLPLAGVELPVDKTVQFFLFMGIYFVLNIALSLWKKCEVDTAHVLAYEAIAYPEQTGEEFGMQSA